MIAAAVFGAYPLTSMAIVFGLFGLMIWAIYMTGRPTPRERKPVRKTRSSFGWYGDESMAEHALASHIRAQSGKVGEWEYHRLIPCCMRDRNRDGDCDQHPQGVFVRRRTPPKVRG